jgi:hypothetical protein
MTVHLNFVRQQGFKDTTPQTCSTRYPALMFQPRVLGILVLLGVLLESGPYFLVLAAILWWNVIAPRLNPFDAVYYQLVRKRQGLPRIEPAPAPRRFAQGLAGTLALAIGWLLMSGRFALAWGVEVFLLLAIGALVFGNFCLGSYTYLFITGQAAFAHRTLPWVKSEESGQ